MYRALATVDLEAVRHNVRAIWSRLRPGTRLVAVVKADGYGHGALKVAGAALDEGASGLAVTTVEEAQDLREAGFGGTVLVMGPVPEDQLEEAIMAGAEMAVWSPHFVKAVASMARELRRSVFLHLKVDTGMHRLGISPARMARLAEKITLDPWLELRAVMTHLATADDDPEYMEEQLQVFRRAIAPLREGLPSVRYHAANSAATFRDPAAHFDMVRCGIAMYGMSPFQWHPVNDGLAPALTLSSYVASLRDLSPGDGVSYSLTWKARHHTRVALIPIGYGDGFCRGLSNRGDVLIRGSRYPRVGNVCMDQFLVEVGRDAPVRFGDPVVLLGRQGGETITAEELAAHLSTINYEITCSLTERVRKVYTGEGGHVDNAEDHG